jgi:hypothetical protein
MLTLLPNRNLAQKIVFCLKLLHLSVPYSAILALEEAVLNLVPWFDIFTLQSHLNPSGEQAMNSWPMFRRDLNILASGERYNTREVACCRSTLIPHTQEKVRSKSMDSVKIEEEGLICC